MTMPQIKGLFPRLCPFQIFVAFCSFFYPLWLKQSHIPNNLISSVLLISTFSLSPLSEPQQAESPWWSLGFFATDICFTLLLPSVVHGSNFTLQEIRLDLTWLKPCSGPPLPSGESLDSLPRVHKTQQNLTLLTNMWVPCLPLELVPPLASPAWFWPPPFTIPLIPHGLCPTWTLPYREVLRSGWISLSP